MSYAGIAVIPAFWFTAIVLFVRTAYAQPIPVLTVCEALHDLEKYNGKVVIVVGRAFWTFEGSFMNEECGRDGTTMVQGQEWLNMIAFGPRNVDMAIAFEWDMDALTRKLKQVQQTTRIQERAIPISGEGWSAVCGRLESPRSLQPPGKRNAGNGYGANGSVPAQLRWVRDYRFPR
jgi:hypothetical protein